MVEKLQQHLSKLYHYHTKRNLGDLSNREKRELFASMVIVGTDGGRILGLGDWGANGRRICKGKAACYFLGANGSFLPEQLAFLAVDVGTDRKELWRLKGYDGLAKPRKRGKNYSRYLQLLLRAIDQLGIGLFQFEDFQGEQAWQLLSWARENLQNTWVFNDDLEGTGAMIVAALLSAERQGISLKDSLFVFNGAGGAASGIASQLIYLLKQKLADEDKKLLRERLVFADSAGLLYRGRKVKSLRPEQFDPELTAEGLRPRVKKEQKKEFKSYQVKQGLIIKGKRLERLRSFMQEKISFGESLSLENYLQFVAQEIKKKRFSLGKKGTIFLIGTTTKAGTITDKMIKKACQVIRKNNPKVNLVLLGISNPTAMTDFLTKEESLALKKAQNEGDKRKILQKALLRVIKICQGKVVIATGSPFPAVSYRGRRYQIAQGNNFLIFPGVGLGFSLVANLLRGVLSLSKDSSDGGERRRDIWPEIWLTASQFLVDWYQENQPARFKKGVLLPEASDVPAITERVALAVALKLEELRGKKLTKEELRREIAKRRDEFKRRIYPSEEETARLATEKTLKFITLLASVRGRPGDSCARL